MTSTRLHSVVNSRFAGACKLRKQLIFLVCFTLMALSAYTTAAVASNTGVPLSDDDKAGIEGIVNTGQRGANLFAVNVPGETFSELSGTLGHSAIDISLTGNTPLSYHLRRDFEEIPNAYPYALGNMSIRTPHLSINTNLGKIDWKFAYSTVSRNQDHANFSCQNLTAANNTTHSWAIRPQSASIELFNDVELVHEMGSTKLLPKHLIYPPLISKFPDDTVLASNDGWYMKCGSLNPDLFEVHRPDGTVYTFDHTASIEQRSSKRVVPATWLTSDGIRTSGRSDSYFNVYRLNAKSISRLDASIQFIYETSPELNVSGQVHLQRVHAPLSHYGASNIIVNKQRLKTVLLRYKHPAGGDRVNSLHFNYRANNANHCPGLLNSVNAAGRYRTARVRYLYEGLGGTIHDNKIGTPMSKCILAKVEEDPVNYSSGTGWLPKWEFEYGFTIVGDPTDHGYYYKGVGYSNDAKTDWNEKIDDFAYLPLKKVTVPTGASVNYEYVIEYPCRYQPITGYGPVSSAACSEYKPKRPSLAKRSVVSHSDDETTFNYLSEVVYELPTHSEIKRTIKNGRTPQRHEHVLTFKRILRGGTDSYPGGPNPEIDEALRDNGKLMSHEIKNSSGSILQIATIVASIDLIIDVTTHLR